MSYAIIDADTVRLAWSELGIEPGGVYVLRAARIPDGWRVCEKPECKDLPGDAKFLSADGKTWHVTHDRHTAGAPGYVYITARPRPTIFTADDTALVAALKSGTVQFTDEQIAGFRAGFAAAQKQEGGRDDE